MWVASDAGLQRIDPRILDKDLRPPPVLISKITVEGTDLTLPEDGMGDVELSDLESTENSVSVQFLGLNLRGEASLRYSYLLEGYDDNWSTPTRQREVNFANLSAGSYRFLVRAIDQRGVESETPAMIQFRILRPIGSVGGSLLSHSLRSPLPSTRSTDTE